MDETKTKLIQTAEALFMRYGLKSVSMDDIARSMGVSKKTLYQLIENKEALITEVMIANREKDMQMIMEAVNASSDAIDEFLRISRNFIREMREVSPTTLYDLKKYYGSIWEEQMEGHIDTFILCIGTNLYRGVEEGLYRDDMLPDVIARIYAQTVLAITDTSIFPAKDLPLDQIIRQHALYHLNGVVNEQGKKQLAALLAKEQLD